MFVDMKKESFMTCFTKVKVVYLDSYSSHFEMHNYSSLIEGQKRGQVFTVMVLGNPDAAN